MFVAHCWCVQNIDHAAKVVALVRFTPTRSTPVPICTSCPETASPRYGADLDGSHTRVDGPGELRRADLAVTAAGDERCPGNRQGATREKFPTAQAIIAGHRAQGKGWWCPRSYRSYGSVTTACAHKALFRSS